MLLVQGPQFVNNEISDLFFLFVTTKPLCVKFRRYQWKCSGSRVLMPCLLHLPRALLLDTQGPWKQRVVRASGVIFSFQSATFSWSVPWPLACRSLRHWLAVLAPSLMAAF